MAIDEKDPGTMDLEAMIAAQDRRAYLRKKKAESRARIRKVKRSRSGIRDANLPDQVTLTLSRGAKALLAQMAEKSEKSMSAVVEELIRGNRKFLKLQEELKGLDWRNW